MSNCQGTSVPTAGPENRIHRCYGDVRGEIRDADLLLFRRCRWWTRLIA